MNAGRLSAVALDEVRTVFDTNVFDVIAVTKALLPLLREAPSRPRIVNMASSGGSLTLSSDPANPRRARFGTNAVSKAALNTVAFAAYLESVGINSTRQTRASEHWPEQLLGHAQRRAGRP